MSMGADFKESRTKVLKSIRDRDNLNQLSEGADRVHDGRFQRWLLRALRVSLFTRDIF